MPSNAMKISQLIERLYKDMQQHGDLDVVLALSMDSQVVAVDGRNINVARELGFATLANPALVIGMWAGHDGKLSNRPGAVYQASSEPGEWNYDRTQAPNGQPLVVWKRYGGKDWGTKEGDRWFVYEGATRTVEIVPDGILAWKFDAAS